LPSSARILAVSKLQDAKRIRTLHQEGQKDFGENYVQEALAKQTTLADLPLSWHFIGHLQKNKVKDIVGRFSLIHSVDSLGLAEIIDRKSAEKSMRQKILLQMNLAGEATKGGFSESDLDRDWSALKAMPNLEIAGLMTMPPLFGEVEQTRPFFKQLRKIRDRLATELPSIRELSMGTSHDYRVAADEGATWLRLGTILFGERPPR
jgi:pyridoxal phosphate enzyme (YggS family)